MRSITSWPEILGTRAADAPDALVFRFLVDGEEQAVTYTRAELDRAAKRVAAALQAACRPGDRALLLYAPSLDFIAAFLGCLCAGVVAVPVYPPDPRRLQHALELLRPIAVDAAPTVALTTRSIAGLAKAIAASAPELASLPWIATDALDTSAGDWREHAPAPESLALLQYTSGSTGTPKGVMLSHKNLLANSACIYRVFGHTSDSIGVGWLPPYHDMGLIGKILQPIYFGGQCTLMSPLHFLERPFRWLQAVSRYRATTSGGPNFGYDLAVRKSTPEMRATLDLSCWRVAFVGAEPVRAKTLDRFAKAFAPHGFRREALYPCYGLAESTLALTGGWLGTASELVVAKERLQLGEARASNDDSESVTLVASGVVVHDHELAIVAPETRRAKADGEVGEIWAAGPSVAEGYWRAPAATAETFGARRADAPERGPYLRTGDLGFVHEGQLFVTGRASDVIIVRGRNHYPQDLELTVESASSAVRPGSAVAFALEDGQRERVVVLAEVDAGADGEKLPGELRAAVAREHGILVDIVALVARGGLPKTSSGKVRRKVCRAAFAMGRLALIARFEPAPTVAAPSLRERVAAAPPGGASDAVLDWLQRAITRLAGQTITFEREVHLLAVGIDSVMAVDLALHIEQELGVQLPADEAYDRTLGELADHIAAAVARAASPS